MRNPMQSLPTMLAPPRTERASAAVCAITPCSVRIAARFVTRPFSLNAESMMMKAKIQKGPVRNAAATVVPDATE